MSKVFLSHSHADKAFARRLAADLRLGGHTVWIDEAEINIGDSLVEKIREGLDQVDFVAAVISAASVASPWVTAVACVMNTGEGLWCCTEDGRRPPGAGLQEQAPNHPVLLRSKGVVVSDWGKVIRRGWQVRVEKMSESKPSDDASLCLRRCQN